MAGGTLLHGCALICGNRNSVYVGFIEKISSRVGVPRTLMISTSWSTPLSPCDQGCTARKPAAQQRRAREQQSAAPRLEQRLADEQLRGDATAGPDVDSGGVVLRPEYQLGGSARHAGSQARSCGEAAQAGLPPAGLGSQQWPRL